MKTPSKASSRKSSKGILKAIGCPYLRLYRGEGYWYFVYDDLIGGKYDTHSVMTMRLADLSFKMWVDTGQAFATLKGWVKPVAVPPPPKPVVKRPPDLPLKNYGRTRGRYI